MLLVANGKNERSRHDTIWQSDVASNRLASQNCKSIKRIHRKII